MKRKPTPAGRAALQSRPMTHAEIYGPGGLPPSDIPARAREIAGQALAS